MSDFKTPLTAPGEDFASLPPEEQDRRAQARFDSLDWPEINRVANERHVRKLYERRQALLAELQESECELCRRAADEIGYLSTAGQRRKDRIDEEQEIIGPSYEREI